ncbi:transcription factor TFIIIB component B'' homolog [Chaetodon trifascialis]|uniref:transcription factor TFIIIB component B'' homolog n=1 Tax=Chaetodon trifascialis TaxID=109706 RepID=UPI0039916381
MFRRSRFSIRPNVGTAGRTAATPQEAPSVNQEASETPKDVSESSTATAVTDNTSVVSPSEKPSAAGDGNDQNGEGTSSSAAVQRRKRFSVKPKVAPGRPSTLARTPKSPVKAVSETRVEVSDLDKPTTSRQAETPAAPPGLQSPRRRRTSEDSKQPKVQPKPTIVSPDSSRPAAVPPAEDSLEQTNLPADSSKQLESTSGSPVKEVPSRLPDKVPPSLPDKEAIEISEKAKTLVSSKSGLSLSPPALCLSRLLNNPSDLQRIAKARKLRELLRHEMHKEKKIKKAKARAKEYDLDPAKMTMRDLIRYLPLSNPMTSSLEDRAPENETVVPPSPGREESPERAQEPEVASTVASPRVEEEEEAAEEEQDDAIMVPQVKVAEDGSLIIDEESLTVEVQRAKGPNPAQDRDPIFERGSTTTYSSFRKGTYSKPWSSEETDMFFLAVSMVGTDFSMICQLFPHRARSEIKNKFKKEERQNAWRIDKAFRERRKLDIEYFSKLLEKILEVQKNRKKLKSLAEKNSPKKRKRKAKGKKAAKKLSDVEEEDEEEENEIPLLEEDEEEEGEKENEDLCNEGGSPVSKPKKKRQRKSKQDASAEEPKDKKSKTGEQDEAYIPEDAEAALPEDRTDPDISEKTENAAKDPAIKPAKLSRGRAPKPLLPLGRKWAKKAPPPSTDKEDEGVNDGASDEQVNKDASPIRQADKRKSADDDISSEEEGVTIQPPRPTRYGRVPKPTNLLTYAAKDDAQSSASEAAAASPAGSAAPAAKPKPKCAAKRARSSNPQSDQESKKPKLVTLWASQSDYSDEENERQWEEEEEEEEEEQHPACSSSKDSIAPAFVPVSLRSPTAVISEVEETMEELDILANMPDVLGISQDALCPDASCELAQNETGTAEPCEHQLDLLVDVIDFLSADHTEVTEDDGYNEAAQTLLAIGNLAHLSQSAQNQIALQDHTTETASVSVEETKQPHVEVEIASEPAAQEEDCATPLTDATHGQGVRETPAAVVTVELQNTATGNGDVPIAETSDQRTGSGTDPTPQLQSCPERANRSSPQTRRGRLSKVKPKPNLGQASRTAHSKSQPETSAGKTSEDTDAPGLSQATETQETPKIANQSPKLSKDEISSVEVKLKEEPSGSQETSVNAGKSGAAASDRSASENQSLCSSGFEPTLEQATRDSAKTSCHDLATSVTAVTELTAVDSPPVEQSSDHPAPHVSPAGDSPVSQKEEGEAASSRQTRRSRFQKVKPKPNLAQTSRTVQPQTIKHSLEKDSDQTPNPKLHEKATVEVEAELNDCTFPATGPASDLIPSCDLGSNLTPTEEQSTTEGKNLNVEDVCQEESDAATSDQRVSEYQNVPEAQFEPSSEQAFGDTRPASESTEEQLVSPVGTSESSCSNPPPSDSDAPESQAGQGSNVDSPVRESSDQPVLCATHAEESAVSQTEEREAASTSRTRKDHLERDKPISPKTSRTVQSKPQTTEDPIRHMQLVEKPSSPTSQPDSTMADAEPTCSSTPPGKPSQIESTASLSAPSLELSSTHKPTEELSSTEGPKTDVGVAPDPSSEASEQNIPQRRRRFPKVKPKPNLGSSARTPQTKLRSNDVSKPSEPLHVDTASNVTSEQQSVDNSAEKDNKQLTSAHSLRTEVLSSTELRPAESETLQGASSDGIVTAESQTVLTDSVLDNKSSENPVEGESTGDRVEAGLASQWDCKQDLSVRATETNNQPADDPTAVSGDGSSEVKVKSALPVTTQSTPGPKESTLQPRSENDSQAQSQDPVQQCSEPTETNRAAARSTEDNETTDSSKSSRKAPLTRRGRLVKPKPNLGRSRDPPQPQKAQTIKQAEADSGSRLEGVDASASQQPASEVQPDVQKPAEGASEQRSNQNPPPHAAGSSQSCKKQKPESCSQSHDASASSAGGTQSHPSLTLFTDMLSVQVPSDPDEPFFILSLTEIPVCSSGEAADSVSEPLSYLPTTDAAAQQQSSVPGEGLGLAARDGRLSNAALPGSTEESGDTGLVSVKDGGPDAAACVGSIMENPLDPHESSAFKPSILPETGEDDEAERPSTKQRLEGPGRTAKRQVKPKAPRTKQARKTPAAKDAETIPAQDSQDSELPVQPKACEVVPQTGSGEAAQTRRTRNRKPKDFPSFLSETNSAAPSSDASAGNVQTPPAAGERPAPVASTSRNVAPAPGPTGPEETHPTASTAAEADVDQRSRLCSDQTPAASACTAEVAASQQIASMDSSSVADEPTTVSQYFLSDIFTDVEEG